MIYKAIKSKQVEGLDGWTKRGLKLRYHKRLAADVLYVPMGWLCLEMALSDIGPADLIYGGRKLLYLQTEHADLLATIIHLTKNDRINTQRLEGVLDVINRLIADNAEDADNIVGSMVSCNLWSMAPNQGCA